MVASSSPLRTLLSLAWPVIVSRSTQVVVGLADSVMVAHLGETALAATTTGGLNAVVAFIFPMGMVFAVASFSSQLTGRGDAVGARRFGWYGLALAAAAQVVVLAALPLLTRLLEAGDYSPDVEALIFQYLYVRLLSTGAVVGTEALAAYFGGTGNTRLAMRANVSAMVLNVILNWLLIDGHLGLPALGVTGAAWASSISTILAFAGFLIVFIRARPRGEARGLQWGEFVHLLRIGAPAGLNVAFEFLAFVAFINVVVAGLGTVSLAAMMAVMQLNSVAFMPAFGLASAGAILVGQAIGRGNRDAVPGILLLTFLVTAFWMGLAGLLYLVIPEALLHYFVPAGENGARFLRIGARMLVFSALWQVFDAAGITISEALRAAGDTAYAMWTRGVLAWLVFLPGSWITVRRLGGTEQDAVLWLLIYLALLAVVLYVRFRSGAWRRIELVGDAPH